ncbi:MAG: hypothetical protein ACI8S6_005656 [Myxococcota bacterium]|jgi:hypothetical protein
MQPIIFVLHQQNTQTMQLERIGTISLLGGWLSATAEHEVHAPWLVRIILSLQQQPLGGDPGFIRAHLHKHFNLSVEQLQLVDMAS